MAAVTGKGGKTRDVPVVDAVRFAVDTYLDACPFDPGTEGPLFISSRGGALNAGRFSGWLKNCGSNWG